MRARTLIGIAGALVIARCALRDTSETEPAATRFVYLQTAVLRDGFGVLVNVADLNEVIEVERDGTWRNFGWVEKRAFESRVVGTADGAALVWREQERVKIALVRQDGTLGDARAFGTHAVRMCDGVASNDDTWAIGWLERGGGIVAMRGNVSAASQRFEMAKGADWCTLASSGEDITVFWREGERTFAATCTHDGCTKPARIELGKRDRMFAAACSADGCAIAYESTKTTLAWIDSSGAFVWKRQLDNISRDVSLANAGTHAVAAGYVDDGEGTAARVTRDGIMPVWTADARWPPAVAWSRGQLLIARDLEDVNRVDTELVAMPE
jgi:hypothetical protein